MRRPMKPESPYVPANEGRYGEVRSNTPGCPGRWAPAAFYALNVGLWLLTAIAVEAWDLLYLVFVTLPPLALYLRQTR